MIEDDPTTKIGRPRQIYTGDSRACPVKRSATIASTCPDRTTPTR
jgi:hypothetical protein